MHEFRIAVVLSWMMADIVFFVAQGKDAMGDDGKPLKKSELVEAVKSL
jgi:2,3-bisphosphoglycerate-independent phosphoglycerate mutase